MYIEKTLDSGIIVAIVVPHKQELRLRGTCFRGTSLQRAGNFSRWNSAKQLFADEEVMEAFMEELNELRPEDYFVDRSVCITCGQQTGWESTAPIGGYSASVLERFTANRKGGHGLRVRPRRTDVQAPKTRELTIVYKPKKEDKKVIVIVNSIYPGVDVGEMRGNVTDREGRIFFDWNHPGAP